MMNATKARGKTSRGITWKCTFNREVDCDKLKCTKCGWNPAVESERKAKIRKEMGA